jgi:hypothetical protein
MTSYSILSNKEQVTYFKVFNINNNNYLPIEFHCYFELAISNAFKSVFPSTCIKYCL